VARARVVVTAAGIGRDEEHSPEVTEGPQLRSPPVKTQSYRFRGGVARIASWHGRADVASLALRGRGVPSSAAVERLLDRLRDAGYREVVTNALAPGTSLPLVDVGFAVRGRLHLLVHDLTALPPPSSTTRRARKSERAAILAVDAAGFDEFWRFDEVGLREAVHATPRSHLRVAAPDGRVVGYALFGRASRDGYVQRLAVDPAVQGHGVGQALLVDGMHWLREHGATRALVNTQEDNERALDLYVRTGFQRLPVGLCVLGRRL
jgi:ribosomal protein S18 acetylase RimI-like enzyme